MNVIHWLKFGLPVDYKLPINISNAEVVNIELGRDLGGKNLKATLFANPSAPFAQIFAWKDLFV